jgi:GNAT superfamily N-acetyltransferase
VVDEFIGSYGEDGTIFGLPDTTVQLEIVRAHKPSPADPSEMFVLYLDDVAAVEAATAPLRAAGLLPLAEPHPYWAVNHAVAFSDPDGRQMVFAPWVFGRDAEPSGGGRPSHVPLQIGWHHGDRSMLRSLFAEAEDSAEQLDSYLHDGRVLVAWRGPDLVGHLQMVSVGERTIELKNMAVGAEMRGIGIGRALVNAALAAARSEGANRMVVATATADIGNLRFYQRCGFRFLAIEREAFGPGAGYPEESVIDGIPLRDRVWLDQSLPIR